MRETLKILSIALIYCGTVFGAGFASGQEIFQFFSRWGGWGVLSSILIGFSFSFFGFFICRDAKKFPFENAESYFTYLFPKHLARTVNFICSAFLVVTFCIMISGCGTLLWEQFSLRPAIGGVASLLLCYFIIKNRVNGLETLNMLLTPILFLGVTFLCIFCFIKGNHDVVGIPSGNLTQAGLSGVLYLSYNAVSAVAVLVPSAALAKTPRGAGLGAVLGGILIAVPLFLLSLLLTLSPETQTDALPFFSLVRTNFPSLNFFCGFILFGAMLTTAASAGVSVLAGAKESQSGKRAFLLCLLAFLAAQIPFAALVATMYTLFGLCGIVLLIGIIKSILRK